MDELPAENDPPLALGIWQLVSAPEARVRTLLPKLLQKARNDLSDRALSNQVIQLMQEFMVKRFVNLSKEELSQMLELHDIRDSRAVKEACDETKKEMARKLLAQGVAPAMIAKAAGMTANEVRRLASEKS